MDNSVYKIVTDRIIAQMEQGIIPWHKPWISVSAPAKYASFVTSVEGGAVSHRDGKTYSMLNQMLLGKDGEWLTFKQIQDEGGKVKKGEKSSIVTFWKQLPVKEVNEDGDEVVKQIPFLRYYNVFHISQCEGITAKYPAKPLTVTTVKGETTTVSTHFDNERIEAGEAVIKGYLDSDDAPTFEEVRGDKAYYSPMLDKVVVPEFGQFKCANEYYSTAFHELTHSTLKASRCNREEQRKGKSVAFGGEEYSKEELVAEIGASCLCNMTGVELPNTFRNSVAYLQSWMSALKNDPRMIVSAASKAEKAVQYILGE